MPYGTMFRIAFCAGFWERYRMLLFWMHYTGVYNVDLVLHGVVLMVVVSSHVIDAYIGTHPVKNNWSC